MFVNSFLFPHSFLLIFSAVPFIAFLHVPIATTTAPHRPLTRAMATTESPIRSQRERESRTSALIGQLDSNERFGQSVSLQFFPQLTRETSAPDERFRQSIKREQSKRFVCEFITFRSFISFFSLPLLRVFFQTLILIQRASSTRTDTNPNHQILTSDFFSVSPL